MSAPHTQDLQQALRSLLLLKPLSAVTGIAVVVIFSIILPSGVYADYFTAWALYEIVILASNLGTFHATYRYLHVAGGDSGADSRRYIQGPLKEIATARLLLLMAGAATTFWIVSERIVAFKSLGEDNLYWLAAGLACAVFLEGLARFLETIGDITFSQRAVQLSTFLRSVIRLCFVVASTFAVGASMSSIAWIDAFAGLVGSWFMWRQLNATHRTPSSDAQNAHPALGRILRFVFPTFLAQLIGLAYSPDAIKMTLSHRADENAVASFGVAFAVISMALRYLPATILSGIFRPAFVMAQRNGLGGLPPTASLHSLFGILTKVSLLYCSALTASVGGVSALFQLWKLPVKFPDLQMAAFVLSIFVLLSSLHLTLNLVYLAAERSSASLTGTILGLTLTSTVLIALQHLGAAEASLAAALGELGWCVGAVLASVSLLRQVGAMSSLRLNAWFLLPCLASYWCIVGPQTWAFSLLLSLPVVGVGVMLLMRTYSLFTPQEQQLLSVLLPTKLVQALKATRQIAR